MLMPLLARLPPGSVAILDERLVVGESLPKGVREWRVKGTVFGRLKAERLVRSASQAGDTVLSFGNLPPLFRVNGRVVLFLQNRYLRHPHTAYRQQPDSQDRSGGHKGGKNAKNENCSEYFC